MLWLILGITLMIRWIGWTTIRCVVTLACTYTLNTVIYAEGYSIPFNTLLVGMVMLVIMIKFWSAK